MTPTPTPTAEQSTPIGRRGTYFDEWVSWLVGIAAAVLFAAVIYLYVGVETRDKPPGEGAPELSAPAER